jgi:hypothetical protein
VPNASTKGELRLAELDAELLDLFRRGIKPSEIAGNPQYPKFLHITAGDISARRSRMAEQTRARSKQIADEAFMIHNERLEWLWAQKIQPLLDSMTVFDRDLVTCAIKVMERHSKLLGTDRGAVKTDEWFETKSDDEIKGVARRLGIKLPEEYVDANSD